MQCNMDLSALLCILPLLCVNSERVSTSGTLYRSYLSNLRTLTAISSSKTERSCLFSCGTDLECYGFVLNEADKTCELLEDSVDEHKAPQQMWLKGEYLLKQSHKS